MEDPIPLLLLALVLKVAAVGFLGVVWLIRAWSYKPRYWGVSCLAKVWGHWKAWDEVSRRMFSIGTSPPT